MHTGDVGLIFYFFFKYWFGLIIPNLSAIYCTNLNSVIENRFSIFFCSIFDFSVKNVSPRPNYKNLVS